MQIGPGISLAHYEIVDLLGKGGMGEVWRARDTRLKRDVALKVLPHEMASDPVRLERFQHEAETIARLNHPHIVTVYSVEEANDTRFLTMELVEGESLYEQMTPDGLPLETFFQIGIAVADALAAAHEKHIVHRDLKPGNILVARGGLVKVLDFGLATLPGEEEADEEADTALKSLTDEGAVMGTLPYMSPEQTRGRALDQRSDIFSLGILLYELATGRRPFVGETTADLTSSIIRDTPAAVTEIRPELPTHLGRIIAHCLEKDPDRRTQSARDVRNELELLRDEIRLVESGERARISVTEVSGPQAPATGGPRRRIGAIVALMIVLAILAFVIGRGTEPPERSEVIGKPSTPVAGPDPRSIAVLPFVDMSPNQDQAYFSDGISEELLNLLSRIPELRVTSRSSSFSFKGKGLEIREISRRLNVAHVLEGSVRKAGDQVRITAQLVDTASDTHVWSRTWDRELDDIFAIQDEIASDVVRQLEVTLLGETPKARKTDPEAYALYLQATQLGRQRTPEAYESSDELYHRVLEIDPGYAPAWSELARNEINKASIGMLSLKEGFARAQEATTEALAIDPRYAPAHATLGFLAMYGENDLSDAARHLEQALALDPADLRVLGSSASLLQSLGRLDESLELREAIVRRDPINAASHSNLGIAQLWAGRFDQAIESFRSALSLSPGRAGAHYGIGVALLLQGKAGAALAEIEQESSDVWRMIGLPMAYHALGRAADSDAALEELIAKYERGGAYNIAYIYAFRGDSDRAFEWLNRELEYGGTGMSEIIVEILFTNLHDDPRWHPLLREAGKAPEQLDSIEFQVRRPAS